MIFVRCTILNLKCLNDDNLDYYEFIPDEMSGFLLHIAYQSMLPSVDVRDSRIGVYLKVPLYDKGNAFANADKVRATIAGIQDQTINARRVIIENLRSAYSSRCFECRTRIIKFPGCTYVCQAGADFCVFCYIVCDRGTDPRKPGT